MIVIKFSYSANWTPPSRRVAILTRNVQVAMRAVRGAESIPGWGSYEVPPNASNNTAAKLSVNPYANMTPPWLVLTT